MRALKIVYIQAEIGYHYLRERFHKLSLTDEEKALLADNLVVTDHFMIVYVFVCDKNEIRKVYKEKIG